MSLPVNLHYEIERLKARVADLERLLAMLLKRLPPER